MGMIRRTCENCLWSHLNKRRTIYCHRRGTEVIVDDTSTDEKLVCYIKVRPYFFCEHWESRYDYK